MKQACNKVSSGNVEIPPFERRATAEDHLRVVASTFVQMQEQREDADYDVSQQWSRQEVERQIESIEDAFRSWMAIRDKREVQQFLVLLLGPKQRKRPT